MTLNGLLIVASQTSTFLSLSLHLSPMPAMHTVSTSPFSKTPNPSPRRQSSRGSRASTPVLPASPRPSHCLPLTSSVLFPVSTTAADGAAATAGAGSAVRAASVSACRRYARQFSLATLSGRPARSLAMTLAPFACRHIARRP